MVALGLPASASEKYLGTSSSRPARRSSRMSCASAP